MFVDCVDSQVYLYFILGEEHQGGGHDEGEKHDDQGEGVSLGEVVSKSVYTNVFEPFVEKSGE